MFETLSAFLALTSTGETPPAENGSLVSDWLPGLALVAVIVVLWGAWHHRRRRPPAP